MLRGNEMNANSTKKMDAEEKKEEESELEKEMEKEEEEIQDEVEIFDEDIVEFIPSTKKISTLNQINISEEPPLKLEENLKATTILPSEEDESFKYGNQKRKENEDSNYQTYNPISSPESLTSFERLNREKDKLKEIGFIESTESRISQEKNYETYQPVKRFDKDDFKKSELERKEIKYKPLN